MSSNNKVLMTVKESAVCGNEAARTNESECR